MTYGPNPWQQTQWDWRAAANFIGGGAGAGLIVLVAVSGAQGPARVAMLLLGLLLVVGGLICVWLEIGRPLRALHVFFNPRTSWMTREAFVAALLVPVALGSGAGLLGFDWLAALLALAFVYSQSRILHAARGIPAWREPMLVPLMLLTSLAEGGGLLLLAQPTQVAGRPSLLALVGVVVLARALVWPIYLRRLAPSAAARAQAALDGAGRWLLLAGSVLPMLLIVLVAGGLAGHGLAAPVLVAAGVLSTAPGAWLKFILITRGGFNQGFALKHLPVRGVRR